MSFRLSQPQNPRRGVTLVEMLVAVALLVLMMTIIVQVFAAATGAVSAAKTYQDLDSGLSALDQIIRSDLKNISATLTPPLNPADNKGYFEYGENTFADVQGEDTDDYLRFTVWAPEGQYFTGKMYSNFITGAFGTTNLNAQQVQQILSSQPITITSQTAEIIYFLRNGNLYRRVLLVAPERQTSVSQGPPSLTGVPLSNGAYLSNAFQSNNALIPLSWQGVNDLSARPSSGAPASGITLNSLGDLTNRENRAFYSRFADDFDNNLNPGTGTLPPDTIPDDEDLGPTISGITNFGNGIHDYYPSLYYGIKGITTLGVQGTLVWEINNGQPVPAPRPFFTRETAAFPYVFPGAYSVPDLTSDQNDLGLIHTTDPTNQQNSLTALNAVNQNPIDLGDSLPAPTATSQYQTWWGFPTWRETLGYYWTDPTWQVNGFITSYANSQQTGVQIGQGYPGQPNFLHPYLPGTSALNTPLQFTGASHFQMLPPMSNYNANYRPLGQLYSDAVGDPTLAFPALSLGNAALATPWNISWEDDLILSNVRSFDVKAYDNSFPGYVDLGWGDDLRLYSANAPASPPFLNQTPFVPVLTDGNNRIIQTLFHPFTWPSNSSTVYESVSQTYSHEGRMPPRIEDYRFDATYGSSSYQGYTFYNNGNIGDDQNIVRLRRVWDTWSTDYSMAPATGYDPTTLAPIGPPFTPPVYPSYPAPYPMPLRGIQIQIRVVDPANQRPKVLTIRQDFSDKLE